MSALPARRPPALATALACLAIALLALARGPAPIGAAGGAASRILLPQVSSFHQPRLAFLRYEAGSFSRYSIRADGGGLTLLLGPNQPTPSTARWSPDGRRLAMVEQFTVGGVWHQSLWVLDMDTLARKRLTDDTFSVFDFGWSPGGDRIAITAKVGNPATNPSEIYTLSPDGSETTRLTDSGGFKGELAWSPDGTSIAVLQTTPTGSGLDLVGLDGSGQRTLFGGPGYTVGQIAWSPDGQWLAFGGVDPGLMTSGLYRIRADGTGLKRFAGDLLPMPTAWSPDGRWLLVRRLLGGGLTDLAALNAEDGSARVLVPSSFAESWSVTSPAWSPTGDVIAFTYQGQEGPTIAVVGANGSGLRDLTRGDQPVWLP